MQFKALYMNSILQVKISVMFLVYGPNINFNALKKRLAEAVLTSITLYVEQK